MKAGFRPSSVWYKPKAALSDTHKWIPYFLGWKEGVGRQKKGQAKNIFWRASVRLGLQPWYLALIPSRQPEGRAWMDFSISCSRLPKQWGLKISQQMTRLPSVSCDDYQVQLVQFKVLLSSCVYTQFNFILACHACVGGKRVSNFLRWNYLKNFFPSFFWNDTFGLVIVLSSSPKLQRSIFFFYVIYLRGGGLSWEEGDLVSKLSNCCQTCSQVLPKPFSRASQGR